MDAVELARWTRFAAKGGIGKCTALCDCVAENVDDLMFLKDDEITVLMQLPEPPGVFLVRPLILPQIHFDTHEEWIQGYCEGVVGRFDGSNVHFHSRLKKPIMAKRSSVSAASISGKSPTPRTRVSIDEHVAAGLVLPPSSPEYVPKGMKTRFSAGSGLGSSSRRSSAGTQEGRSDGEREGYGSSRGASPAMPNAHALSSPALRPPSNLGPGSPSWTPATPPPPPAPSTTYGSPIQHSRTSFASSKHASMLSAYSQASEYDDEPKFVNTSVDTITNSVANTSVDTVTSHLPTAASSPQRPPSTSGPSTTTIIPPSISSLSNSSLYTSASSSSTLTTTHTTTTTTTAAATALTTPSSSTPSTSSTFTQTFTSPTNPDTSTSTYFDTSRISLALSDGEVGIGLSLLQDLADDGWGGSDSDSDLNGAVRRPSKKGKGSIRRKASKRIQEGKDKVGQWRDSTGVRASVASEMSRYSSEDGLGYEDTETGHSTLDYSHTSLAHSHSMSSSRRAHSQEDEELEADITQTQAAFSLHDDESESPVLGRSEHHTHFTHTHTQSHTSNLSLGAQMMTFPPVAPLSPSRSRFIPPEDSDLGHEGEQEQEQVSFEFPTPPTHTPTMSFSFQQAQAQAHGASGSISGRSSATSASSPPTSFVRPAFAPPRSSSASASISHMSTDSRARRPSTVSTASSFSAVSGTSTSDWDADIYDDYRYSRFSSGTGARSFSSRVSVGSRAQGSISGSGGGGEWPPEGVAVGRPSIDSSGSAGGSGRQNSIDSQMPAPVKGRTRSRSNTTASLNPVVLSPIISGAAPSFVQAQAQAQATPPRTPPPPPPVPIPPQSPPQVSHLHRSPPAQYQSPPVSPRHLGVFPMHRRTDSESEGSVYSAQPSARLDGTFGAGSGPPSARLDGAFGASLPLSPLAGGSFVVPPTSSSSSSPNPGPRPAPLQLASSNHASPIPPSPLSPTSHQPSEQHQHQHQSIRSPLLHTGWGSAVSSPVAAQFATIPVLTTTNTSSGTTPSTGSSTGAGGRVLAREMSAFFPAGLDALGKVVGQGVEIHGESGEIERVVEVVGVDEDRVVLRRGLVMGLGDKGGAEEGEVGYGYGDEEDEEEREGEGEGEGEGDTLVMGGRVLHESPSFVSSPEPDVGMGRLGVANRTPSPSPSPSPSPIAMVEDEDDDEEDEEELEREKEELRRMAAAVSISPPTALAPQQTAPLPTPAPPTIRSPPPASTSSPIPAPTPAASHLRPTLAEIRPPADRQSLFLPHPNAPKATPASLSPGPNIASIASAPPPSSMPLRGGALQTIHMALRGHGGQGQRGRGPTIYGIATSDLSAAMGPVLMHFSVSPPPATAPPPGSVPTRVPPPVSTPPPPAPSPLRNAATPTPPPPPPASSSSLPPSQSLAAPVPRIAVRRVGSVASLEVTPTGITAEVETPGNGANGVIPRANFFPKAGGVRPRSRSFSGFQSTTAEIPLPIQMSRALEDQPSQMPTTSEVKRSLLPIIGSPTTPTTNNNVKGPKPSPLRVSSPLSRQDNSAPTAVRPVRPPNSPLMQSFATPFSQPPSSSSVPSSPTTTSPPRLRQTASRTTLSEAPEPRPAPPPSRMTLDSVSTPSPPAPHTPEFRGRPSVDGDSVSIHSHSSRSNVISPPPVVMTRKHSLRTKLSLPNLNLRRNTSRHDEPLSPMSPTADADLLQVKDTDFELVRPNFGHLQGTRSSEDSGVMGRDMSVDARQDGSFLRADSPSLSLNAPRSPTAVSDGSSSVWQPLKSSGRGGTDSEASSASMMDAHRQRELKWMTVLGSVPPAQSRKSKKVKKLIFDGVPESMRYLVWSMLTDGKARCVPGVYAQLGGRGRVAALADVERDVQRCFADQPQLQSTQGPVLSLLQAYLTMVPDVQYVTGLTLITGHLLLLAPEEDAFWIFVSVMDTHIRPYFSSSSMQIDVAGTLFGRAMDSTDPTTAKKLFGDFGITPSAVCRPWFTSLFVGFLPSDYLNRVWDIFLFEGVPFLFRVAIVLVSCCRRQIFEASSADAALSAVLRPSPEILPTSPEALITLALAVKLKDDDLRKQRVKLEAQVKRQTQAPRTISTPSSISLPRT
ncbi:hypothetical protein DXG01_015319 [Tephrocybe rancida]|nr:hypothetical protein DXG01_015319 [Tephrocybe rancida]